MNILFKKSLLLVTVCALTTFSALAAQITIESPAQALANRQPIVVRVFLDPEEEKVSGLSGDFSFPTDLFTLEGISNESSVVSLWVNQPALSNEKYFDNRTHVTFEGIFPGGFDGVQSPYYTGKKKGIIFSVTLMPKDKGVATLLVDDIMLNAFTSDAKRIPVESAVATIYVPTLLDAIPVKISSPTRIKNQTLSVQITRNELVNNNAWYVLVHDTNETSAIQKIQIAETNDYNGELVRDSSWRIVKNPYVLLYQARTKYINVKVTYANNTYTTVTIPPVENSQSISLLSRILVSVVLVLLVLYFYGKSLFIILSKKKQ